MITVSEHLERVLDSTGNLEAEVLPLAEARGRCLADPVVAAVAVPPWTNSAMDGYAVRFEDVADADGGPPVTLEVVADIPAGSGADPDLGPGQAARIMTGAPVPTAADTVIPLELTDRGTGPVVVHSPLTRGRHIRHAGEDRQAGDLVVPAGSGLTPETLAAIASAGQAEVRVLRQPKVVVVSTGDELVSPGSGLSRGQIPDSNSLLVTLLAADAGAVVTTDHAGDAPGELAKTIERVSGDADAIVMTGGVSVGAHDPVKALFEAGGEVRFDRVSMQPGKPQAFGQLGDDGPLVFGLPGNPVSAWASFQIFVRPSLRRMQGFATLTPEPVPARASEDWNTPQGRMQVIPVRIHDGDERRVMPAAEGGSGSHLIASLADADGYALVDAEVERVRAGDLVRTVRLRDPEQFNHQRRSTP